MASTYIAINGIRLDSNTSINSYSSFSVFPTVAPNGSLAVDLATGFVYEFNTTSNTWSNIASPVIGTPTVQTRYVTKSGNDSTGNGAIDAPFLTVGAAAASITDATVSKQYVIMVGPGTYSESNSWSPEVFKHILGDGMLSTIIKHTDSSVITFNEPATSGGIWNAQGIQFPNGFKTLATANSAFGITTNLLDCQIGSSLNLVGPSNHATLNGPKTVRTSVSDNFNTDGCVFTGNATVRGTIAQIRNSNTLGWTLQSRDTSGAPPTLEAIFPENYDFSSAGPHRLAVTINATTYTYTSTFTTSGITATQLAADLNNASNWSPSKPINAGTNGVASAFVPGGFPFLYNVYVEVDLIAIPSPTSIITAAGTTNVLANIVGFSGTGLSGTNMNTQVTVFNSNYRAPTLNDLTFFQAIGSNNTSGNASVRGNSRLIYDIYGQIATGGPSFVSPATAANNFTYGTIARWLGYTPAVSGDWNATIVQAAQALDNLAANKLPLDGSKAMTGTLLANFGVDVTATGGTDTLSIGATGADVINIGRSGATVNIQGTTLYENVSQLQVTDPLITINKGGAGGSGGASGIEIEEASSITGYDKTSSDRNSWQMKAPNTAGVATITPGSGGITLDQSSHDPVTLTAVGSTPNADGASLSGQALTLQPADSSNPGIVSATDQEFAGNKTFDGLTTLNGELRINGNDQDGFASLFLNGNLTNGNLIDGRDNSFDQIFAVDLSGNLFIAGGINLNGDIGAQNVEFASSLIDIVSTPASAGTIRLGNNHSINWRDNVNSADFGLTFDNTNTFQFNAPVNVTGNFTSTNYPAPPAEQDLGSLTWSAGVAPSGTIVKKYRWNKSGNLIQAWFKITASVAGTAVTGVSFTLPGDMPNPSMWASQPNSTAVAIGSAGISAGTDPTGTGGTSTLSKDGSGNYIIEISDTAVGATFVLASISYLV